MTRLTKVVVLVGGVLLAGVSLAALPDGYKQVRFISAEAGQYFNGDWIFSDPENAEVEVEAALPQKTGYKTLVYTRCNNGSDRSFGLQTGNTGAGAYTLRFDYNRQQFPSYVAVQRVPHVYHLTGREFFVDGGFVTNATAATFPIQRSVVFFVASNSNDTVGSPLNGCGYGMKIWDVVGGERKQIAEFVPVRRESDGIGGFYDTIRNRFFASESGTDFVAPTNLYSIADGDGGKESVNTADVWGVKPTTKHYCILTNSATASTATGNTESSPWVFAGGTLQVGEIGGNPGDFRIRYWGKYGRVPDMILAKGRIRNGGQTSHLFCSGRTQVLSAADDPFLLGISTSSTMSLGFSGTHRFYGDETAMLGIEARGWAGDAQALTIAGKNERLCLFAPNPNYFGRWKGTTNTRLLLGDPQALGGERESFAEDALEMGAGADNNTLQGLGYAYNNDLIFDFDGTMPSKGRGIKIRGANDFEFIVPTGHVVHCDMPVKSTTFAWVHAYTNEVERYASRIAFGDYEGKTVFVTNVAFRASVIGQTTATTLDLVDDTAALWAEVDENLTPTYTTVGPMATLETHGGKIPLRVDLTAALGRGVVRIPVLKVDTAAKVVTADDFTLVKDQDFLDKTAKKGSIKLEVEIVGTTQTVYLVAKPRGLLLMVR